VETQSVETLAVVDSEARCPPEWVHHVIYLLDKAVRQLRCDEQGVRLTILAATLVLRRQVEPEPARAPSDGRGRLLAWQVRKVCAFIEARISGSIWVSDLCTVLQLSQAHFSRAFKRTFGESPHAFVLQRRLQLAAQCMLQTDASLSDIAQRFGFTDQPHFCRQFRKATGQTPAAWRRAQRVGPDTDETARFARPDAGTSVPGEGQGHFDGFTRVFEPRPPVSPPILDQRPN
jgi:AraC family transcriptional regulator